MVRVVRPAHSKPGTSIGHHKAGRMMRRMSADNHRGQEVKIFHKQAGYMRAMISSHIDDQMSCKRGGSIYGGNATGLKGTILALPPTVALICMQLLSQLLNKLMLYLRGPLT